MCTCCPYSVFLSDLLSHCLYVCLSVHAPIIQWGAVANDARLPACFLSFFFFFFLYLNAITGLTSESQTWSNYLLKDECVSYTWVNLTPLVTETTKRRRRKKKVRDTSCSESGTYLRHILVNEIPTRVSVLSVSIVHPDSCNYIWTFCSYVINNMYYTHYTKDCNKEV